MVHIIVIISFFGEKRSQNITGSVLLILITLQITSLEMMVHVMYENKIYKKMIMNTIYDSSFSKP